MEAPQILEMFPAYYIFNGLFSILLILHVVWTFFIYKIAYRAVTKTVKNLLSFYISTITSVQDSELQDSRSDSEEEEICSNLDTEEELEH